MIDESFRDRYRCYAFNGVLRMYVWYLDGHSMLVNSQRFPFSLSNVERIHQVPVSLEERGRYRWWEAEKVEL